MATAKQTLALGKLRDLLLTMKQSQIWKEIVEPRDQVFARFQAIFAPAHIPKLTAEEFKPILYFETNHHWTGLHRQGLRLCEDMPKLRKALVALIDETRPLQARLDEVAGSLKGFGQATMTAILHVAHPDKYGVWNNTSKGALVELGLYPEFDRGEKFGSCYVKINSVLTELASALGVDLWTLDALWWMLRQGDVVPGPGATQLMNDPKAAGLVSSQFFGLERHLHDFLFDNWDTLEIGREWEIYGVPGDEDAGYEFPCPVGRIDLLAKHRTKKKWLIVELKRSDTSDATVGQALRYMGWVRHHLAEPGDEVHGLIIAREGDDALRYAVSGVPNLTFQVYEVEFRLKSPPPAALNESTSGVV
jgi:hypothetical protein